MRLVTFGCSYTNGAYLDSQKLWPAVLADHLEIPCVNRGVGGAGNLEILWYILNFKFEPTDIVVIMWSNFTRDHIFSAGGFNRIRKTNDPLTRYWVLTHTDYDSNIRNWIYIQHADLYIKQFSKVYHLLGGDYFLDKSAKPSCTNVDNFIDIEFENYDLADDNSHPGQESHKVLAEKIYNIIR